MMVYLLTEIVVFIQRQEWKVSHMSPITMKLRPDFHPSVIEKETVHVIAVI